MAKKKKLSKNEKAAQKAGVSLKEYKSSKKSSSKKDNKKSSKTDDKFKKAMKDKGVWDAYQKMSPEQQEFLKFNWSTTRSDAKRDIENYQKALDEATKQADPYWKSYLMIAQDEVQRAIQVEKDDANTAIEKNQRLIDSIKENLTSNKEFLTLEQQSDLAQLARNYEVDQEQLVGNAAESGLTFSTKRQLAEKRLNENQQGLVESTQRQYNKRIGDIEREAQSGTTEAQKYIEDIQRKLGQSITSIGRASEKEIGTSNLPQLDGYTPMGNITGEMYEKKTKDIFDRQQALFAEKTRQSLAF